MSSSTHAGPAAGSLAEKVLHVTGANPMACYQCGRCAAGCMQNVDGEMDVSPTRIMRLLQLESAFAPDEKQARAFGEEAVTAETPWLCAGCQACTTRCPQGIDIAGTMDVLREEGLKSGKCSKSKRARDIQTLHRTFVEGAVKRGRVHELAMVMFYKLRTGHFMQDAMLGPAMMSKGKLHVMPGKAVDTSGAHKAAAAIREENK